MIGSGVSIVAAGMVRFGERFESSYEDLMSEVWIELFDHPEGALTSDRIQAAWLSTALGGLIRREAVTGSSLADPLHFFPRPVTRIENACAGGSDAVRNAAFAVAAGMYDAVVVLGVEKMRDLPTKASLIAQRGTMSHLWWHPRGATSPYLFGQHATVMIDQKRITREDMALVSVKNHDHGRLNPNAFMRKPVTVEQVLASPPVCEPLSVLDCCPTTDGAAAVVLCRSDLALQFTNAPIELVATGLATDTMYSQNKTVFGEQPAVIKAAQDAYSMAGITPSEVSVAELHDCFTVAELLAYEDLGFCEKGDASSWLRSGAPALGGVLPCNPSGGLLSKGHPIGATGVAQLCEVFWQLRGEAGERQVENAHIGLTHNVGGNGQVCCVNIARRA